MDARDKQALPGLPIPTLAELRGRTDADLVELHDEIAFLSRLSTTHILDELARREHYRQTRALERYARLLVILAAFSAAATALMLAVVMSLSFTLR